jgi:fructokinase
MIVGIGEILWDVFPDGPRFGGAPSNFCCSTAELAQGGAEVLMVSAVGDDELGHRAIDSLQEHGVNTNRVQVDRRQTGQVLVELDAAGVASYRFAEDCAWDHLAWNEPLQQLALDCQVVCFGTLGQRGDDSRATIRKFVNTTSHDTYRILDVNLRAPFFDDQVIRDSLTLANVLKLNDDELPQLARLCGAAGTDVEILQQLADQFQLRCVALTRGADGAVIVRGKEISDLPGTAVEVADTVGAGDAFTAALALGLLAQRDVQQINRHAIAVASYICSQTGATAGFPPRLLDEQAN